MRKLIFLIFSFFSFINLVVGKELVSEDLPYYVNIGSHPSSKSIMQMKKIYDKDTGEVVFSTDFKKYNVVGEYQEYTQFDEKIWGKKETVLNKFNNTVYYFYHEDPSDYHYFLAQLAVWSSMTLTYFDIVDKDGNILYNMQNDYSDLKLLINNNTVAPLFTKSVMHGELGVPGIFYYYNMNPLLLDIEQVPGLSIVTKPPTGLGVYHSYYYLEADYEKAGNYKVRLYKDYDQANKLYKNDVNSFWQSTGGPTDLEFFLEIEVTGTKLTINENLIGVNNRLGDATLASNYELYLDNKLQFKTEGSLVNYLKKNSNYVLKDVSNAVGVLNSDPIDISITDSDKEITIDKYVISKTISVDVQNNKNYKIYLKSNDELYETVNSSTDSIVLPYGLYYIKDDQDYYEELNVVDCADMLLVLEDKDEKFEEPSSEKPPEIEVKEEESKPKEENNLKEEKKPLKEEMVKFPETILLDNFDLLERKSEYNNVYSENPKTYDQIYFYLLTLVISLISLILSAKNLKEQS